MYLFVGSTNPVKINAVITAASETWPDVKVLGYPVKSGIADQPRTDEDTRLGAQNRARAALNQGLSEHKNTQVPENTQVPVPDTEMLGLGLEGGVFEHNGELWSTVWVAVTDNTGALYESNGARFKIPELIAQKIKAGEEMGPVVSQLFAGQDIRRTIGAIGVITESFVDRTEEYAGIAKMALGLWYGRDWQNRLR